MYSKACLFRSAGKSGVSNTLASSHGGALRRDAKRGSSLFSIARFCGVSLAAIAVCIAAASLARLLAFETALDTTALAMIALAASSASVGAVCTCGFLLLVVLMACPLLFFVV